MFLIQYPLNIIKQGITKLDVKKCFGYFTKKQSKYNQTLFLVNDTTELSLEALLVIIPTYSYSD